MINVNLKQHVLHKASQQRSRLSVSVTERKLMIVFWFFVLSTVINYTAFSEFVRKADLFEAELNKYFICELGGHDRMNPCDRERVERILSEVPVILAYAFSGFLPLANLVFVISFQGVKNIFSRMRAMSSTVTSRNIISLGDRETNNK